MTAEERPLSTAEILKLHEELETKFGDGGGGDFLFGWQSENPFAAELLAATKMRATAIDYTKYSYMETDDTLRQAVLSLHEHFDGERPEDAFCAASGGTAILFSFGYWLARIGIKEVYYVPPIYFTLLNSLRQFGIRARAVSGRHAFEAGFSMNLPTKETVLIVADPIWYAGLPVPEAVIDELRAWQNKTDSLIFVDGSFQYMRWDDRLFEPSAKFKRTRTIRLVSPTKSLVVHGYRFGYVLLPASITSKFSNSYTNVCGPAAADNIAFAHEAVRAILGRTTTEPLIDRARGRHSELRRRGVIESSLQPASGYFVFEKLNVPVPDDNLRMDGRYFGQPRYPGYTRMNLLSTKFHSLGIK